MPRRTTIEIDEELLARAKRALGHDDDPRLTVEEALAASGRTEAEARPRRPGRRPVERSVERPSGHLDLDSSASDDMWR